MAGNGIFGWQWYLCCHVSARSPRQRAVCGDRAKRDWRARSRQPLADRWDRQTAICVGGRWCLLQEWAEEHYDEDGFPFLVWQTAYAWRSDWESIAALARGEEVDDD